MIKNLDRVLTREVLETLYIEKEISSKEIALKFQCSPCTVLFYLKKYNIPRRTGTAKLKISGTQRGPLFVIRPKDSTKNEWFCRCICGKEIIKQYKMLMKTNISSCGCLRNKNKHNKHYKGMCGSRFGDIKKQALQRGLDFTVTIEYLWNLFESQERKCAITGLEITLPSTWVSMIKYDYTASLDRIDNNQGYIFGNVHWVHKTINKMRNSLSLEEFKEWCNLVTLNYKIGVK